MAKKITPAQAAQLLKGRKHQIGLDKAVKMAKRYQKFRKVLVKAVDQGTPLPAGTPSLGIAYSFDKKGVQQLLKETGAVGLRIYPGVNDANEVTMILVAFDAEGNNIHRSSIVASSSATKKSSGATSKDGDDEDGVLDDSQMNPPYPTPSTP